MEYGITIPRGDIAEQPSPWKYLTNFARESEQMGCTYDRMRLSSTGFSL